MSIPSSRDFEQRADAIRREIRAAEERGDRVAAAEWTEEFEKVAAAWEAAESNR